jgi:phosphate starvation-inducible membrane PsiE
MNIPVGAIGAVAFQTGNAAGSPQVVSSALSYFEPFFAAIMLFLGVAFWASLLFLIYYGIEAFVHPTPFGRSSRLASMYDHVKSIIWGIIAIYLVVAVLAFAVNQASAAAGAGTSVSAGQLFYYVFVEPIVNGFKVFFSHT